MTANAGLSNLSTYTIGIDLMGADVPPNHILEAVASLPPDFYSDASLVLFGTQELSVLVEKLPGLSLIVCPDVVKMDENPLHTIREKKDSSLRVGIRTLREGRISAFISCANTGALVAVARSELDALQGISRPALACHVPTHKGDVVMLDVGANVEASSDVLLQFAKLGAAYVKSVFGVDLPEVALLNIGEEALKGTEELKNAVSIFSDCSHFAFVGNKEPYDVFTRQADVFVTNGFSGNLFIKTCEAMSRHILGALGKKYPELSFSDIVGEGSGAIVLGVNRLLVKCHGAASTNAIQQALLRTKQRLKQDVITKIQSHLG